MGLSGESMEKKQIDEGPKCEHGSKILPWHTKSGAIFLCGKEVLAIQNGARSLSSLGMKINHYLSMDPSQSMVSRGYFIGEANPSLNFPPQHDESSIFDSAWATLKGEPWQSSSNEFDGG